MWEERKSLSRTESRISRIVCNVSITGILKFHENSLTLTTIVVQQRLIFLWRKASASKFRLMSRVQSKQQHSPRTRSWLIHLISLLFQHPNFASQARRAQSCRIKSRPPHPLSTMSQKRRSLSPTGLCQTLDEVDEIDIAEELPAVNPDNNNFGPNLTKANTIVY